MRRRARARTPARQPDRLDRFRVHAGQGTRGAIASQRSCGARALSRQGIPRRRCRILRRPRPSCRSGVGACMVHRAGPRRSAAGLLCGARFPGQGIARTRVGCRALRPHRAMAQGARRACLRADARIDIRAGDRRRSRRSRRTGDLRRDLPDGVSLIPAARFFASSHCRNRGDELAYRLAINSRPRNVVKRRRSNVRCARVIAARKHRGARRA